MPGNEMVGTPHLHYSGPSDGPFDCAHCVHYQRRSATMGTCSHPDAFKDMKAGKLGAKDGQPTVAARGCCAYQRGR